MSDGLSIEDGAPNLNTVTLSGRAGTQKAMIGQATGMAFTIGDKKQEPNRQTQGQPSSGHPGSDAVVVRLLQADALN